MIVWCRNIALLTTRFFDVVIFTTLTPLSFIPGCKLSFPMISG